MIYTPANVPPTVRVFFKGAPRKDVTEVDLERSRIKYIARDHDGRFLLNERRDGVVERYDYGHTRIAFPQEAA